MVTGPSKATRWERNAQVTALCLLSQKQHLHFDDINPLDVCPSFESTK